MELLLLLVILIFVLIIFNKQKKSETHFNDLNSKIDHLKQLIQSKEQETQKPVNPSLNSTIKSEEEFSKSTPIISKIDVQPLEEKISKEDTKEEKLAHVAINAEQKTTLEREIKFEPSSDIQKPIQNKTPKKPWLTNFKEQNPDLEKFIGENLINKIGILILVLGISFFVKYAIDKDWINEPARVGIGILAGSLVMGIAHRLRKKYAAFSSVFVAGAISIFYLTIGIAFHDYHLFSQTTAFIIMVAITLFGAFVSVSYDRKELAILTLIGGFAVPFMVSTGQGNYNVLFTYIAILNVGMLIMAYFKKWKIVPILAFVFTVILYSSWMASEFYSNAFPFKGAFIYASIFYLIFSIASVINNIKNKGDFTKTEYILMLTNTFYYFGIGTTILQTWKPELKGFFCIALALYNLVFAMILYRKFGINKNAIYFLLGLALTFITITIPLQFNGNNITLFWAAESVLLLWLSQKSKISTFKFGAIVVQILMLFSLIMDWQLYNSENYNRPIIFNHIFLTGLFVVIALGYAIYLLKNETSATRFYFLTINPKIYKSILSILVIITGYLVGILEVSNQARSHIIPYTSYNAFPILFHMIYTLGVVYITLKKKSALKKSIAIVISAVNIVLYIFFFNNLPVEELIDNVIENTTYRYAFIFHYLNLMIVAYFIYVVAIHRKDKSLSLLMGNKIGPWILATVVVIILSTEVMAHGLVFSGNNFNQTELAKQFPDNNSEYNYRKIDFINSEFSVLKTQIIKIGYPILWGVLSFIFLIMGIKKQNKQLRIIALTLLGITIIKLFLYDIKNVSETGKIIAFILLGVLILIISFVYQKIKNLVVDQPQNSTNEENN